MKIVRTNRPADRSAPIDGVDMFMLSRCEEPVRLSQLVEIVPCDPTDTMERLYRLALLGLVSLLSDSARTPLEPRVHAAPARAFEEEEEQTGVRRILSQRAPAFDDTETMRPPPHPRRTPSEIRDEAVTIPVTGRARSGFEADPHPATGVRARLAAFAPQARRRAR